MKKSATHALWALCVLALAGSVSAAPLSPNWFRHPALSPDAQTIVFSRGGDLFRVSSAGGVAVPLTVDDSWEGYPVWSANGEWLAFASDRHGSLDVFVMPAAGGEARRLTWMSVNDVPTSFSPDGQEIFFSASRMDDVRNSQFPSGVLSELYAVGVEGGTPRQVLTTPAAGAVPDRRGRRLLYEDVKGYEDPLRKHHVSAVTRDLWVVDLSSNEHRQLSDYAGEDREPVWSEDDESFYFLSEREGDFNIFRQGIEAGAAPEQLTRFEHHPVRHLSRGKGDVLCFSWHGDLYTMAPGARPRMVDVAVHIDRQQPLMSVEELRRNITEMAVAPDGKEVAFVARGEVFVTSVDFETTRRITDTAEQERSVSFSPDGRSLLYAGERDGSWNVYVTRLADEDEEYFFAATKLEEEAVVDTDEEEFWPRYSPDGEEVAYLAERTILKVKNLESGRVRTVMGPEHNYSYRDGDQWFDWSPDGNWFSVQFLSRGRYYGDSSGVVKADGSSEGPIDITNSGYGDWVPRWAMKGGAILWVTDRYGEKSHGSWGGESDVMAAFLDRKTLDEFERTKEQREVAEGRKKKGKKDAEGKSEEEEDEGEKDEEEKALEIDFAGIDERTQRLTIHSSDLGDFALKPDGSALLYLARFEDGYDLWAHDFVEESTKLLVKLGARRAEMQMTPDGESVFILADGAMQKIPLSSGREGIESGKATRISASPQMNLRPDEERAYLFDHVWRQVQQKFYRKDLHGVDWDFYREQYEPKLAGIRHNRDFATLLSEMLGELNGSHTGGRWWNTDATHENTPSLGAFFDRDHRGKGLKIAEILERGPLSEAELEIEPGMVITAIDGVDLGDDVNLYALLNGKQGQRVRLHVEPTKGDGFDRVVVPISRGAENQLLYRRWVQQRRDLVERLSGGRIGYVHVRGMNDRSYRSVYADVLGRYYDTDAMVVDTRFNGGGWLHDDLVILLSGKRYVDFAPRNQAMDDQRFYGEPGRRWWKPSAVVMSESNYSDAHFFPWAYKELEIGPLIGMPVAGTSTAVWWERLHTGDMLFGIPQVGTLDLDDGSYLENQQLEPDYRVPMTPEQAARGEDPQLEKAVEVLLETVGR